MRRLLSISFEKENFVSRRCQKLNALLFTHSAFVKLIIGFEQTTNVQTNTKALNKFVVNWRLFFLVSLIKDYNSITKSRLNKLSTLTYLFVLYHFGVKNDTNFFFVFRSDKSTFFVGWKALFASMLFTAPLIGNFQEKIDGFQTHFYSIVCSCEEKKKRRKKQVVDIPVPFSFRDHLFF
jgi:hypothetical protein